MTIDAVTQVLNEVNEAEGAQAANPAVTQQNNAATKPGNQEQTQDENRQSENDENQDDDNESDNPDDWPKKAKNAYSYQKKQINRMKAEIRELRALQSGNAQNPGNQNAAQNGQNQNPNAKAPQKDAEPKEDDFENFGDYLKAVARHEARQQFAGESEKQKAAQQEAQLEQHYAAREQTAYAKAAEYSQSIPDFKSVVEEYGDLIDSFPLPLQMLILDAEDGAMAFYNLAKEGKLEQLPRMSLQQAAFEIGRAQSNKAGSQGNAQNAANNSAPQKPVSKAPAPMTPAKAAGASQVSVENMSADDLLNLVKGRK